VREEQGRITMMTMEMKTLQLEWEEQVEWEELEGLEEVLILSLPWLRILTSP
jgi:hypothetical protein